MMTDLVEANVSSNKTCLYRMRDHCMVGAFVGSNSPCNAPACQTLNNIIHSDQSTDSAKRIKLKDDADTNVCLLRGREHVPASDTSMNIPPLR